MPFCSRRCRAIDAKRWLNEEYSVDSILGGNLEEALDQIELQNLQGFDASDEESDSSF